MRREMIYETWVPQGGLWSLWARPVLFAQMPEALPEPTQRTGWIETVASADVAPLPGADAFAALIVDLPGDESVTTGLALAAKGFRPVPMYNGCTGTHEVVDQRAIMDALCLSAGYLASLTIAADAAPAFLLDARRMTPRKPLQPGAFDNRWRVFPQDFPAARLLIAHGYRRAIVLQHAGGPPQEDLADVLRGWQDAGVAIGVKDVDHGTPPMPAIVRRPRWYRAIRYRALAALGLRRSPRGGFGYIIPEPGHG